MSDPPILAGITRSLRGSKGIGVLYDPGPGATSGTILDGVRGRWHWLPIVGEKEAS